MEENGLAQSRDRVADVHSALKGQFAKMSNAYQGIFITDAKGEIYTGILENGTEYKGVNIGNSDIFKRAKSNNGPVVDELIRSAATGRIVTSACVPIMSESGKFAGVLGIVIKAEYFADLVAARKIGQTGYGYMMSKSGLVLAHPNRDHILKLDLNTIAQMASINTRMMAGETGVEQYTFQGIDKVAGFAPVGINGWSIATAVEEQSTATSEIATNVSQAARGIQEVNTNVSQSASVAGEISRDIAAVSATANEMSTSSAQVNISAEDLSKLAEQRKGMVGQCKI